MKVTDISVQARNPDRVNVSVDGAYRFSLDIAQVVEFGLKVGREIDETELAALEQESEFGKLYARALEWVLIRPRSARETKDYLRKKTFTKRYVSKRAQSKDGVKKILERPGASVQVTERVFDRLVERGYINDEQFARWWVESRNVTKGSSMRKLRAELFAKGIAQSIIDDVLSTSERRDEDELAKIITKKRHRYPDEQKLIAYLARQGFSYDDIKKAMEEED